MPQNMVVKLIKMLKPNITVEEAYECGYAVATTVIVQETIRRLLHLRKAIGDKANNILVKVILDEFAVYLETLMKTVEKSKVKNLVVRDEKLKKIMSEIGKLRVK